MTKTLRIAAINGIATDTDADPDGAARPSAGQPEVPQLSDKNSLPAPLAMVCQLARLAVAGWVIWMFVFYTKLWSDKDTIQRVYSEVAGHALEPISGFQQACGYSTTLLTSLASAVLVVKNWQLFGRYIAGDIFSRQAVFAFRAMARMVVVVAIVELVMRWAAFSIVSNGGFTFWFMPNDALDGAIVLGIVIQAEIFSAGVVIADEHKQIV